MAHTTAEEGRREKIKASSKINTNHLKKGKQHASILPVLK